MGSERYQIGADPAHDLIAFFCKHKAVGPRQQIEDKDQVKFLLDYCKKLKIKRLVFEPEYVDQFFSADYSGYYAHPFQEYSKTCSRIHFFTTEFSEEDFGRLIVDVTKTDNLAEELGYCGFVVVKPLPYTIIGRTCLKPLEDHVPSEDKVDFPTLLPIASNLFGLPLGLNSLPFQEQDREVAACATSALWTALYATARAYQHRMLSPLQITQIASQALPPLNRTLPNDGLLQDHMISIIRTLGLECEVVNLEDSTQPNCQSYVAAYLRTGIPIILSFQFDSGTSKPTRAKHALPAAGYGSADMAKDKQPDRAEGSIGDAEVAEFVDPTDEGPSGLHAVAITGHRFKKDAAPIVKGKPRLRATQLDRLYVHDDRVGPFSSIDIMPGSAEVKTRWSHKGRRKKASLFGLTIPTHRQVRIPYLLILDAITDFDSLLRHALEQNYISDERLADPEWDIYLIEVNKLKAELRLDETIASEEKHKFLTKNMPHFVWRAIGKANKDAAIDLMFDATDLRQGNLFIGSISRLPGIHEILTAECKRFRDDIGPSAKLKRLFTSIVERFASEATTSPAPETPS